MNIINDKTTILAAVWNDVLTFKSKKDIINKKQTSISQNRKKQGQ